MRKEFDLLGIRFGRLVAIRRSVQQTPTHARVYYRCECDCGGVASVYHRSLVTGGTTSCGCIQREKLLARNTRHGFGRAAARPPEYKIWLSMRDRCNNPKNRCFKNYGDRGIHVAERWDSYENFIADMGRRPTPGHTLERKNNDLGYGPDNCVWATRREQSLNKRNTRRITFGGETLTAQEWCDRLGISRQTMQGRLTRGYPPELLLAPVGSIK